MNETIRKIIIHPEATLRDAMKAIGDGEIGISLLVEKTTHKFLRTISDGDIRRALLNGLGLNNRVSTLGEVDSVFVDQFTSKKEVDSLFSNVIRNYIYLMY